MRPFILGCLVILLMVLLAIRAGNKRYEARQRNETVARKRPWLN